MAILEEQIRQFQGSVDMTTIRSREAIAIPTLYPAHRVSKTRELPIYKGKSIKEHQNFFY